MLSEITFIPSTVWGVVWITIAVIAAAYFLLQASQKELGEVGTE
jgi:cbb3-type cytochrome oxidase subunit 3